MNNKLRFELEDRPHPYPTMTGAELERWGQMSISILTDDKNILLLKTEWDLCVLVEWIMENQEYFRNDVLLMNGEFLSQPQESLSQYIKRLQERDFLDEEEETQSQWYDNIFEFHQHHNLSCAFHGSRIPSIIIGSNHGLGEISLVKEEDGWSDLDERSYLYTTEKDEWSYSFDMDDFLNDFQKYREYLKI
ncbi:MAG: hypothetical protein HC916_19105 [Coleofasciculaceae cyanobacterium SM2_1_6]|nr:hypothetical protein [Coleofasciculaceae cyanobacterium SM2_1_6]